MFPLGYLLRPNQSAINVNACGGVCENRSRGTERVVASISRWVSAVEVFFQVRVPISVEIAGSLVVRVPHGVVAWRSPIDAVRVQTISGLLLVRLIIRLFVGGFLVVRLC